MSETSPVAKLHFHYDIASRINFACHQNAFAVLRDLGLENLDQDHPLEDVTVRLEANPDFLAPKVWQFDRIAPGGMRRVRDRDLELDGGYLLALDEAVQGRLVLTAEQAGKTLAEAIHPVSLLAHNEWGGAGYMPELLAAFVTPNDSGVEQVLKAASRILRQAGKPDSLEGYQSGSRERVWDIASSIYAAISNLDITYAEPPASFERDGQKIRLPGRILSGGLATCLDLALLFAAAFEQAGLNPLIALPRGHALVGVWLQPEELSSIVIDEAETLRKRLQLNELVLVETTLVTGNPAPSFSRSVKTAADLLAPELDRQFEAAVDLRRARAHRIGPLALRSVGSEGSHVPDTGRVEIGLEPSPALPDFDAGPEANQPLDTSSGRLDRWQRRLLDLTLHNALLNHKAAKSSLRLICPDPGELEDLLAAGKKIAIAALPRLSGDSQDQALHHQRTGENIVDVYARDALQRGQVLVDLTEEELDRRVVGIYRKTQSALQEGGSNTLYLAIGILLWKRDASDERRYRAPLILMPVSLERRSVRSGVKLAAHDDETRFNTTLLEMLRQDFRIDISGLEGVLPQDDSGVDVALIWHRVRQAVKDAPGFEVTEEVVLGHFSFSKYLMWKDLVDRTEALKQSRVVAHLLDTPKEAYESNVDFVPPTALDRDFGPADLVAPLPADSSQLAAVAAAERGKDFIVIGPPGTGKSQTIANMIAHLLGTGRTVLFVSEKVAALEVVYRRLAVLGLDDFCLQLHSNKARKADVLAQLGSAWSAGSEQTEKSWRAEAEALQLLRDRLNLLVSRLHHRHRNGLTPHQAIGTKVRDESLAKGVRFDWPRAGQHDETDLQTMREAARTLAVQAAAVSELEASPFQAIAHGDWSPQWETELADRAGRLVAASDNLVRSAETFCEHLGLDSLQNGLDGARGLVALADVLRKAHRQHAGPLLEAEGPDRLVALHDTVERLQNIATRYDELSTHYSSEAWREIDGESLQVRWRYACDAWWPKRLFACWSIIREMRRGGAGRRPDPARDAPLLARVREDSEAVERHTELLSAQPQWQGLNSKPEVLSELAALGEEIRSALARVTGSSDHLLEARATVRRLLLEGDDLLAADAPVGLSANDLVVASESYSSALEAFEKVAGQKLEPVLPEDRKSLAAVREIADAIQRRRPELRAWCAWWRARESAINYELMPLVLAVEDGRLMPDDIERAFEAAYCTWWSALVIGEDEVLRAFSTPEHVDLISRFRELDERFLQTTAAYVRARLCGSLPDADGIKRGSQWGVLQRELQKKRRHKPVRQLVQELPDVLTRLAPCLMMSPLSVAQYLPADQALFDVVIFDEASQITVWDAVGAIARGRQTIVAGDPRQLPPTNFFGRSDDDPDGDVDFEGDLESILDEMRGARIPELTLNLHYRSRNESLIAFSNSRYYDNRLVTFPPPTVRDAGIHLRKVEGIYARGGARHNEAEARAIAEECVRRLTHADTAVRDQSIGIVTFNTEQQSLIENLLDEARSKNPELEEAFSPDGRTEPVFVKNLETVQGDERDVILFSVTYGPDASGHVSMNFGPLNREGGERRLNVALTRAREQMIVFTSLRPERIDLSRTQARAVADLKHFLDYAERGPAALGEAVFGSMGDFESPFESAVALALRERGWQVHPQIGVSAFRIDLGIVHPDEAGRYLAGVECDGAMYHSSATARERDKIRQGVLENLGWSLVRIWSTDWWTDRAHALEVLDASLCELLEADRERAAEANVDEVRRSALEEETPLERNDEHQQSELSPSSASEQVYETDGVSMMTEDDYSSVQKRNVEPVRSNQATDSEPVLSSGKQAFLWNGMDPEDLGGEHAYVRTKFDEPDLAAEPELFDDTAYEPRLLRQISHVIATEGPVLAEVLVRRVARHHGFKRAGRQIRHRILELAKPIADIRRDSAGRFYWPIGADTLNHPPARYLGRDDEMRRVEVICFEELKAIAQVIGERQDPVRVAHALGIRRVTTAIRERIEEAMAQD